MEKNIYLGTAAAITSTSEFDTNDALIAVTVDNGGDVDLVLELQVRDESGIFFDWLDPADNTSTLIYTIPTGTKKAFGLESVPHFHFYKFVATSTATSGNVEINVASECVKIV